MVVKWPTLKVVSIFGIQSLERKGFTLFALQVIFLSVILPLFLGPCFDKTHHCALPTCFCLRVQVSILHRNRLSSLFLITCQATY